MSESTQIFGDHIPTCHRVACGLHPGQKTKKSVAGLTHWCSQPFTLSFTPTVNLESPIKLTLCMSLDCWRKLEYLERTHTDAGRIKMYENSNIQKWWPSFVILYERFFFSLCFAFLRLHKRDVTQSVHQSELRTFDVSGQVFVIYYGATINKFWSNIPDERNDQKLNRSLLLILSYYWPIMLISRTIFFFSGFC